MKGLWRSAATWVVVVTLVILIGMLAGCAPRYRWVSPTHDVATQQRDIVECSALAGQAAQGRGTMFSDQAFRSGYEGALREEYLAKCLASRGWTLTGARE